MKTRQHPDGHPTYTARDVTRLAGPHRSQIEYWCRDGIILPEGPSEGTGHHRAFSFRNLAEFGIGDELVNRRGLGIAELRQAVRALRHHDEDDSPYEHPDFKASLRRILYGRPDVTLRIERQQIYTDTTARMTAANRETADTITSVQKQLDQMGIRQDALTWLRQREAAQLLAWRAFKNPATRGSSQFYLYTFSEDWLVGDATELIDTMAFSNRSSLIAVNLTAILKKLEDATGDRWQGWTEWTSSSPKPPARARRKR